jgi:hypothetical protein
MARDTLWLNINNDPVSALVAGQQDSTASNVPELVLGDTPTFTFKFTDNTNVAPSWAGNAQYSLTWAIGPSTSVDEEVLSLQTLATAVTGGWQVVLPLNTGALVGYFNGARYSQDFPVARLWQHLMVTDPSGYRTTYGLLRTNVRARAIPGGSVDPDDPLPAGTQNVLADSAGKLSSPSTFFQYLDNVNTSAGVDLLLEARSGAKIQLKAGANGNIVITPKSTGGVGAEFVQLEAQFTGTQTSNVYALRSRYALAHAGTTETIANANGSLLGEIVTESTNQHAYSNRQTGTYSYINHGGAGALGLPIASYSVMAARGTGGFGVARAFDAHMYQENIYGAGNVTSFTGLNVRTVTKDGGTIGSIYGLYVEAQDAGGANYGVYTAGNTPSYFGGNVVSGEWIKGCTTAGTNLELGSDTLAANLGVRLNTEAGRHRYVAFYTAGILRWFLAATLTSETGSNVGSNLEIYGYSDNGVIIGTALAINRATLAMTLGGPLTVPGGLVSYGANDSGGTGYRALLVPNA